MPVNHSIHELEHAKLHRLIAYTDAVLAIVLTLLILEISVPALTKPESGSDMWQHLVLMKPKFIAFLLSFFVISTYWAGLHAMYSHMIKMDNNILWLNNAMLLFICVTPFTSALVGEYSENPLSVFLFGFVQFFTSIAYSAIYVYSHRKKYWHPALDVAVINAQKKLLWVGPVIFILVPQLAFLNRTAALCAYFFVYVFWMFQLKQIKYSNQAE
jgi:uncharacterized membrane protein